MITPKIRDENSVKAKNRRRQLLSTENSVGKRILLRLGANDYSWLSAQTGIPQTTISDCVQKGIAKAENALKIAEGLGVTVDWLLTGRGDPVTPTIAPESDRDRKRNLFVGYVPQEGGDIVELDEVDLRYGLGGTYIDGPVSAEKRQFSRAWLRQVTMTAPEHLFWATGDGDSMEPTIRTGEIVLIDKSQISPRSGDGIWAIAWGDIGMIKRLRPHPDGSVEILSDNRLVPPATAVDGELHVIGRVIAVVRRL